MLKMPLVTFVVTSYNYEKFLHKTLASIKQQSYQNFEIIIVDDASSDNSVQIAEKFIEDNQDLRITLLTHKENKGQLATMLHGLSKAEGQFISFVDSDDIVMPDYAKLHVQVHLKTSVAFTSSRIIEIGEQEEVHTFNSISSPKCEDFENLFDSAQAHFEILNKKRFGGWYWSPNSSAMYRKATLEPLLEYKNTSAWKICPDKFIMNYAHLLGGSAIIYNPLIAYRRHNRNAGNCTLVSGNQKLHSDGTTIINIQNNLKIRPEMLKFLWQIRNKLGLRNTLQLILKLF